MTCYTYLSLTRNINICMQLFCQLLNMTNETSFKPVITLRYVRIMVEMVTGF